MLHSTLDRSTLNCSIRALQIINWIPFVCCLFSHRHEMLGAFESENLQTLSLVIIAPILINVCEKRKIPLIFISFDAQISRIDLNGGTDLIQINFLVVAGEGLKVF